jgi:hypothetical protein
MADQPREIKPLMDSIEQMLVAIDKSGDPQLDAAVQELRSVYEDYLACCCRRAHVVPYTEQA